MAPQESMQMGLGEPVNVTPFSRWVRVKIWINERRRAMLETFRTRRWLRWGLALILLGGVAASAVGLSRAITAPAAICSCPAQTQTPAAGKSKGAKATPKVEKTEKK